MDHGDAYGSGSGIPDSTVAEGKIGDDARNGATGWETWLTRERKIELLHAKVASL